MKTQNGSMTVEAAMIVPLVLMVFLLAINSGMELYGECCETAAVIMEQKDVDAVSLFYIREKIGDVIGNEDSLY